MTTDYFALFSIAPVFAIDQDGLDQMYRDLQRQFHPDRYVSASNLERRIAAQKASVINMAHTTLSDDVLRAEHLLELTGMEIDHDATLNNDPMFLMQQIEYRERLEDANGDSDELTSLLKELNEQQDQLNNQFSQEYTNSDFAVARRIHQKMQYFKKLKTELTQLQART